MSSDVSKPCLSHVSVSLRTLGEKERGWERTGCARVPHHIQPTTQTCFKNLKINICRKCFRSIRRAISNFKFSTVYVN